MSHFDALPLWAYADGLPQATGTMKRFPADFIVSEVLNFQPEGHGEHVFLQLQKSGENTEYVARLLARTAEVRQRDIGFAGLKDRHAVTTQWFSVWLPGKAEPDWSNVENERIKILQTLRHPRKLKRGILKGNHFRILVRDFHGDKALTEQRLENIKIHGFPNYYAEQRFGHHGQNLNQAQALFNGAKIKREQHSIYLSAARSYLFNLILAQRVSLQNWRKAIDGDVLMLNHSHSYFKAQTLDAELETRLAAGDVHPSGCLYGKGENPAAGAALQIETNIINAHAELAQGLVQFGLGMDRRPLRACPENFRWQFLADNQLQLEFFLPAGSYATALMREIMASPLSE